MAIQERLIAEKVANVSVVGWVLFMILFAVVVALIVDVAKDLASDIMVRSRFFGPRAGHWALTPDGRCSPRTFPSRPSRLSHFQTQIINNRV
jgi:hypothetical protein